MLTEMDQALADEIERKSKFPSVSYSAVNGELLSEENGQYIYRFTLTEPWEPQDDTPLVIMNSSVRGMRCTVVNAAGTLITIVSDQELPPDVLQHIDLSDDSTELLKRQREALKNVDEGEARLASKAFGLVDYQMHAEYVGASFWIHPPHKNQYIASQMSLGGEVTFIVGPPGTGKTVTLAAIALEHLQAGRSVLIAAHTNIAIDNAIMKICDLCEDKKQQELLAQGQVVRYGAVQKYELKHDQRYAKVYLPKIVERLGIDLHRQHEQTKQELDQVLLQLDRLQKWQFSEMDSQQHALDDLNTQLTRLQQELAPLIKEERNRISQLQSQQTQLTRYVAQLARELVPLNQQLASSTAQVIENKRALEQERLLEQQYVTQLVDARAMSGLKRFFKGIPIRALEEKVAHHSHTAFKIEQSLQVQHSTIERLHQTIAGKNQEKGTYQQQLAMVSQMLSEPSEAAVKIVVLQEQIDHLQRQQSDLRTQVEGKKRQFQLDQRSLEELQTKLKEQLGLLDQQLRDVERSVVAKALIVGTTLTKTYMNQTIAGRRFDAVILDEVSMAPLPLLYIATAQANRSVTLIGDPQQLAPIVTATTELAKKWLGEDLFHHRKISLDVAERRLNHSVMLDIQSRMHPRIAAIVSELVYDNKLNDSKVVSERVAQKIDPLAESPLILCDTHDASPVVSRPARGRSRINYYHALCSLAIARKALASMPAIEKDKQTEPRIGIITPYAPQAKLIQKLVKEAGRDLPHQIQAGTVHRFQGLEFDVVIFDTVESPGIDPTEFTAGVRGSSSMRLINVAVTRARHKLFVVANRPYIQQKLSQDSILRQVVERAAQAASFSSLEVVGTSLASIVEQVAQKQPQLLPPMRTQQTQNADNLASWYPSIPDNNGEILVLHAAKKGKSPELVISRPSDERKLNEQQNAIDHFTEATFFSIFKRDVRQAKKSIVIASPFISLNRSGDILPLLLEKQQQGVSVKVVTRPWDQKNNTWDIKGTQAISEAGIELIYRPHMHEKVVIIDDQILYHGSLNILSHSDSKDSMLRFKSPAILKDVNESILSTKSKQDRKTPAISDAEIQKLKKVTISIKLLPPASKQCVCGGVLVARLRKDGSGPFYGCQNYRPGVKHSNENISLTHIQQVQQVQQQYCPQCSNALELQINEQQARQFLLVCSNEQCSEKQHIVFVW
jgi:hypothetical protein